jgi:hypothetical protein
MAGDIPEGLHLLTAEKHLLDRVSKDFNGPADKLAEIYKSAEFQQKANQKFTEEWQKRVKEENAKNAEYYKNMRDTGYSQAEIDRQRKKDEEDSRKLELKEKNEFLRSLADTSENIKNLRQGVDDSLKSYKDFQEQVKRDIKQLKESGATDKEIEAYLKKNKDFYDENTKSMISALDKFKNELSGLANGENISAEDKYILNKQLRMLEKSYDLQEANFNKQSKIFEQMNEDLDRLRESEEEQRKKERRQTRGKFRDTLLTTMLGPFRLITDPLLKAFNNNRDTFGTLEHRSEKTEAKYEIYEKSRSELNKLAEDRQEDARIAALMSGADTSIFEKPAAATAGMKALRESFAPKALLAGLKESLGFGEMSFDAYSDQANRQDAKDALYGKIRGLPKAMLKGLFTNGKQGQETLPSMVGPVVLPSSAAEESAIEQGQETLPSMVGPENDPMLDRIAPDQNTLLAKGGVVGAGFVFLARKLGLITDAFEDAKSQDKDGLDGNVLDFVKKNGLGLMKVAAPLAVTALGGVMIAKGMEMQKRDSEDAHKYFDEGNTARGIETLIFGDRARVSEENANQELGRTAGKSALLAGGAGLVAAGGAGTAAMVGTVASAGGIAAAGGLGAVGTAGMAAMGSVLPPALIAAAVVTAGMVVAKGTQEAFELGWDKNQAAIQKELADTMLSEDSTVIEKIKADAAGLWKGFTGGIAGGIREAEKVLDAETMIQNEKQINYIREQAEAGNGSHQRLLEMMMSEQFKAFSEEEQKAAMQAEGLYDDFRESQESVRKNLGEHLATAGRAVGGFFEGMADTTMEGMRGRETAVWEKAAMKGMENMSGEDVARLQKSDAYRESLGNGGDRKKAMETAYLAEAREKAVACGDLREDGMAIQEGNWLAGMAAGAVTGGAPGALAGALGGAAFGKYLGFGDTGMAYKEKQSDEEYRQTFEYSKRKTELLGQGMSAEEADIAAIEEQNALYERAMTLRLKQSKDYKKEFDKQLAEGKSIKQAEEAALRAAKENRRNTMTTTELVKDKFREMGETLGNWAGNIGGFFKDKFSDAGKGLADLGGMVKEGAQSVWNAVSEWFSGIWRGIRDKVKDVLGAVGKGWDWAKDKAGEGLDWVKDKAGEGRDWFSGLFSGRDDPAAAPDRINDGIVTKDGRVIEVSPDDNIYATKNEFKTARDQEAQAAMPAVPGNPAEFTDTGIIAAIQVLTDVLRSKEMAPAVISQGEGVNFDQFRMAEALL